MERPDLELGRHTWAEVDQARDTPVLLVPIGSTEQHGPHLPLDTDTRLAVALARTAAERIDVDPRWPGPSVLVTPPITITASGEHQGFPGTLSVGTEVMRSIVVELVRSADWATAVVLVNGHGGNHDAVSSAIDELRREQRRVHAWWPRVPGGDPHAGRTETSLLLALDPEVVRVDRVTDGPEPDHEELRRRGVRAVSPNGVLGSATRATAEHGHEVATALVDDLVAMVRAVATDPDAS